ncbi:uncharacterized protein [Agelaius tricolor]|uniref:uncharacterized protein isoform X7 n=1 Tax=Agelaius tricolor TaxID=9191 RepID=UPI0039F1A5FB
MKNRGVKTPNGTGAAARQRQGARAGGHCQALHHPGGCREVPILVSRLSPFCDHSGFYLCPFCDLFGSIWSPFCDLFVPRLCSGTLWRSLTVSPVPHLSLPCPGGVQEGFSPSHCPSIAQVVFRNALEISHYLSLSLTCPFVPRLCSGTLWRSLTVPLCPGCVQERSGDLSLSLFAQVVFRNALEIGFLGGQYFLYGFNVPAIFECDRYPCVKEVECYVSRPTEKSVFLVFMFAVSGVCVLLNLAELNHLGWRKVRAAVRGARARRKSLGDARRKEAATAATGTAGTAGTVPALGRTQSSESAYV